MAENFEAVYAELRVRMLRAAGAMVVAGDGPGKLSLNAPWAHPTKPRLPMWFGGVQMMKGYVSYHLMPVYGRPAMLDALSLALRKRMQGKACFNFKTVDPALFDELEALTARSAATFAKPLTLSQMAGS